MLKAFFEHEALNAWWQVARSVTTPRLSPNSGYPAVVVPAGFTTQVFDRDVVGGANGAKTAGELTAALARAITHDGPCMIEVAIDPQDCSPDLREWGTRVAAANGMPPRS